MVKKDDDAKTEVQVEILSSAGGDEFYKDIPEYSTASDDVRALMDAKMKTVNWSDLKSIIEFSKEDREDILQVSRDINDRAMRDNSFIAEMRECAEAVGGVDLTSLTQRLDALAKSGLDVVKNNKAEVGTGLALAALVNPLVGILGALGLKGARVGKEKYDEIKGRAKGETNQAKVAELIRDELRQSILSTRSLVAKLEEGCAKIPQYVDEVNQMGAVRTRAYSNLAISIGAGRELLRRFYEEVLPEIEAKGTISMQEVQQLKMAGTAMSRTVDGLFASRAVSLNNVVTLSETLQIYTDMYLKFQEHLTSSVPEWEGLIAHGNLMVDRMELQMVVSAADKKGIELHEKAEQLHETSRELHRKSMEQGTYDLARIAQTTERLVSRIKTDMLAIEDQSRKQQAARERLDNATLGLAETFHRSVQKDAQMVLGHAPKSAMSLEFQAGAQALNVPVANNDNEAEADEAKPAAKSPRAPRAAKPSAKPK